ncbi:MAG: UDP-N-acetylglucosamine 2-epimerase (non-hydrolyzing), partial [Desulfobacterales bacterium]
MPEEKLKILTIFGTRKELIRLYPVMVKLKNDAALRSTIVTTSQLQEEMDDLYALFGIRPDHDLNLRRSRTSLADITNLALSGLEPLLKDQQPDMVLVQGESTSAFVGALAAFYHKIPVAHNGAGVRTFNKLEPYPEEVNRRLVSTLSDLHFVSMSQNTQYLLHEGAIPNYVFVTGNSIMDSILDTVRQKRNSLSKYMPPDDIDAHKLILITSQIMANWGKPLRDLCHAVIDLTQAYPDIRFAFPLKFDSGVRDTVNRILKNKERIHLLDQLPYEAFVEAMARSYLVITDSDCIAEEGLALRKPVLLLQEKSEQKGYQFCGAVKQIGLKRAGIVEQTSRLIEAPNASKNLFAEFSMSGDGHAADRIVQAIKYYFG